MEGKEGGGGGGRGGQATAFYLSEPLNNYSARTADIILLALYKATFSSTYIRSC